MKFNISLLSITLCASLFASDGQPQRTGLAAMRARLRANRGQTAPELTREQQSAPSTRDLIKAAQTDNPEDFEKTLRSFLDKNPGCKTWDDTCDNTCPKYSETMPTELLSEPSSNLSDLQGFNQPISCKKMLKSCYQYLRGCLIEKLNSKLSKTLDDEQYYDLDKQASWQRFTQNRNRQIALICQGADPDAKAWPTDDTALHLAARSGDYHLANFLLKHKANPNIVGINGYQPIHGSRSAQITKLLLKHGANVNAKTPSLDTPLHLAMSSAFYDKTGTLSRTLISDGADMEAVNENGHTPLLKLAASCMNYSTGNTGSVGVEMGDENYTESSLLPKAKLLLQAGANGHQRAVNGRYKGMNSLEIARKQQEHPACKALADYLEAHEQVASRIQE